MKNPGPVGMEGAPQRVAEVIAVAFDDGHELAVREPVGKAEREPLDARRRRGVRGPRRTPRGVFLSAGTANHPAFLLVLQTRVWAR